MKTIAHAEGGWAIATTPLFDGLDNLSESHAENRWKAPCESYQSGNAVLAPARNSLYGKGYSATQYMHWSNLNILTSHCDKRILGKCSWHLPF